MPLENNIISQNSNWCKAFRQLERDLSKCNNVWIYWYFTYPISILDITGLYKTNEFKHRHITQGSLAAHIGLNWYCLCFSVFAFTTRARITNKTLAMWLPIPSSLLHGQNVHRCPFFWWENHYLRIIIAVATWCFNHIIRYDKQPHSIYTPMSLYPTTPRVYLLKFQNSTATRQIICISIGSVNGFVPNKRQVITWTIVDLWRQMASLYPNDLHKDNGLSKYRIVAT